MRFLLAIALLFVAGWPLHAQAQEPADSGPMTFFWAGNGGNCETCAWIAAQGEITPDTPEAFRTFLQTEETYEGARIVLHSPGGDLLAGIDLGRMIRNAGMRTDIGSTFELPSTGEMTVYGIAEGYCASACAFAFMGGTERSAHETDARLGVHQFYMADETELPSQATQRLIGLTLYYSLQMGVDARVIVTAGATSPEDIYWFDRVELAELNLVTATAVTSRWRLEPLADGLILAAEYRQSETTIKHVRFFCHQGDTDLRFSVTESNPFYAAQFADRDTPLGLSRIGLVEMGVDEDQFDLREDAIESVRREGDDFSMTLRLSGPWERYTQGRMYADPVLANYLSTLLDVDIALPDPDWLAVVQRNCISGQ